MYEFVILTVLQISNYCNAIFNNNFCATDNFKYFLLCVMLPVLVMLFFWWMPDIARPFCKNKCQCEETHLEQTSNIKESREIISRDDMERLVTGAIIMGIQKFASMHPKTTKAFNNIIDALQNTKKIKKK